MRDQDADFTDFVQARWTRLCRFAFTLVRDDGAAEDLVQRALIQVYAAWPRIRSGASVESYSRTCVTRCFLADARRRRWREVSLDKVVENHASLTSHESDLDSREAMWQQIGALPPRQRAVVVLRYYEDLTEAEIADVLGCRPGTVKSQASKALTKLRQQLESQNPASRSQS